MYAGAQGHVDTEEYLTGRAIDKTFEQFRLGGADPITSGECLKINMIESIISIVIF